MLEEVERDSRIGIQGHDFSINERIGREPFTGTSDLRELLCERVSSSRPKRHPGRIFARKTTVPSNLTS
jgi:hypothetical protein